jgi:6-phosphogluconolactonase
MSEQTGAVTRWQVLPDSMAVAEAARARILEVAREAIDGCGSFRIVLAGGSTPEATYGLLAQEDQPWNRWRVYFGDERCLPPGDAQRNSRMALETWLGPVGMPLANVHVIPAEEGAEAAARAYAPLVASAVPFDLVLLGMGEDGHTASLFPDQEHDESEWVHAVHQAPKPPPDRVSLSIRALAASRRVLFLVTGAAKREAVAAWHTGAPLPAARVAAVSSAEVLLDEAAAS